jgi:gamma-glutamylcyclotransferase (GGCT)/AIG2-like uncharacterized protein YtfP
VSCIQAGSLLFVYGTLLPGLALHGAMQGARCLGKASVPGRLFDLGPYPALVAGPGRVVGLLYAVSEAQLARLDALEEYDPTHLTESLYLRQRLPAALAHTRSVCESFVYVYNRAVDMATPIAHGDYRRYLRERSAA